MKKRTSHRPATLKILQQEIDSKCPFCPRTDVAIFEVHHIVTEPESNHISNLIMLCPSCHEEITKGIRKEEEVKRVKLKISSVISVEVDEKIKPLLVKLGSLIDDQKYDEAEVIYFNAKDLLNAKDQEYSIAKLNKQYARIVNEKYFNLERQDAILIDCLNVFIKYKQEADIAYTKELLAQTKAYLGDNSSAEIFAIDFLAFAKKKSENDLLSRALIIEALVCIERDDLTKAIELLDEAKLYGIRSTHSVDEEEKSNGNETIAICYHNKSIIFAQLGKIVEAKGFALKALEGYKEINKKTEYAQLLFQLTEMECLEGNFAIGRWNEYIQEAKDIFREIQDFVWLARCIDLVSRIAYMSGHIELSLQILQEGYQEIKQTNDKRSIAICLRQLIIHFLRQERNNEFEEYRNELTRFTEENNLQNFNALVDDYITIFTNHGGDIVKRNEHLYSLIEYYRSQYSFEQSQVRKAKILGRISKIYYKLKDFRSVLRISHIIAKIYKEHNIIGQYANALLDIGEMNLKLGKDENIFDLWQEVIEVVEGLAFYDYEVAAKINCGYYLMNLGKYEEAQYYADEASYLVEKYMLRYSQEVEKLLEELEQRKEINRPPNKSFSDLIIWLYQGLVKRDDVLEPLLRYWYGKNILELFKYFYQIPGLRGFLISDRIKDISEVAQSLSWLFSYFLVSSPDEITESGFDDFIYPYESPEVGDILFLKNPNDDFENKKSNELNIERYVFKYKNGVSGEIIPFKISESELNEIASKDLPLGKKLVYHLANKKDVVFKSNYFLSLRIDGESTNVHLTGYSTGLPKLFYDYFRCHKVEEVINLNYFVASLNRFSCRDKFYEDLRVSSEMNYIPIYINDELYSKQVSVLCRIQTNIPYGNYSTYKNIASASKVFNSLFLATNQTARMVLDDFKFTLDNLFEFERKKVNISVILVEFRNRYKKIIYPIVILHM